MKSGTSAEDEGMTRNSNVHRKDIDHRTLKDLPGPQPSRDRSWAATGCEPSDCLSPPASSDL